MAGTRVMSAPALHYETHFLLTLNTAAPMLSDHLLSDEMANFLQCLATTLYKLEIGLCRHGL
jgi:hypothetical protein